MRFCVDYTVLCTVRGVQCHINAHLRDSRHQIEAHFVCNTCILHLISDSTKTIRLLALDFYEVIVDSVSPSPTIN